MAMGLITTTHHTQTLLFSDNTPSVSWVNKMASRANTSISNNLLRGLAMLQRATGSAPPFIASIAGAQNGLADTASRLEKIVHPNQSSGSFTPVPNNALLSVFNTRYPLTQEKSWHVVTLPAEQISLVISTLRRQRLPLRHWTVTPGHGPGSAGPSSVSLPTSTLGSEEFPELRLKLTSWLTANGSAEDIIVPANKSKDPPLKHIYGTYVKATCWQASRTIGKLQVPTT
jgi:hypothetical protein